MDSSDVQSLLRANINAATEHLENLGPQLATAADLVTGSLRAGHQVLACGNGGSAADAAHLVTELVGRYEHERRPYAAVCLNDSGAAMSAISNDYGFDHVFARQVRALGHSGDVLIVLSTSGRSPNVRIALEAAVEMKLTSIAFLGRDGGDSKGIATVDLIAPGNRTPRIQEAHKLLYHTLCELIDHDLE